MATVPVVLEAYLGVQRNLKSPAIEKLVTKFGRISIPLFQLMAFAGVVDEGELVLYETYIRKSRAAQGFRGLVDLSHSASGRGRNRVFTFDLTIGQRQINSLLILYNCTLPVEDTPAIEPLSDAPEVKKVIRISKKVEYTPSTLSRYSKGIVDKVDKLFESELPSSSADKKKQVFAEVLRRLLKSRHNEIENDHTNDAIIVGNIKCLVISMRLHGNNSSEQSNFQENIALAVSGNLSMATLEASTGLSRRTIEHGRGMRENFNSDVRKADDLLSTNTELEDSKRVLLDTAYDSDDSDEGDVNSVHLADHDAEDSQPLEHSESQKSRKRKRKRNRGNGDNMFRDFFATKTRKVRCDKLDQSVSLRNGRNDSRSNDTI